MKTFYVLIKTSCPSDQEELTDSRLLKKPGANTFHIGSDNGLMLNLDSINSDYMQTLKKLCHEADIVQSHFKYLYSLHLN
jgi:hypothetical protein